MNELEQINAQLNEVNAKRVKYQTLKEQAIKQCEAIEKKYNVKSLDELGKLVEAKQAEYNKLVQDAQDYITKANQVLDSYGG